MGLDLWWRHCSTALGREPPCGCCVDLREHFERHLDADDLVHIAEPYSAFATRQAAAGIPVRVSDKDLLCYALYKHVMACDGCACTEMLPLLIETARHDGMGAGGAVEDVVTGRTPTGSRNRAHASP